ncbi:MAG: MotA/TolQ/ExbB proton channel family protein [Pseudomonadota bacterium]
MNTPFGFVSLWAQGDIVIKSVAVVLLGMSLASWCIIATKTWHLVRLRKIARSASGEFWHSKRFEDGLALFAPPNQDNPFYALAQEGAEAVAHHAQHKEDLHGTLNVSDWIVSCLRRSLDDATMHLQTGLSVLASIGSTAPFVGLFGTVWGIYHALVSISVEGQATIDKVAGPVGEALIMTAFGLAVAIPAVLGYNALTRSNKGILLKLNRFAHDLHAYFVTGGRIAKQGKTSELKLRTVGS